MFNVEPDADKRAYALSIRQVFVAFKQQGFDDEQAMDLTLATIAMQAELD